MLVAVRHALRPLRLARRDAVGVEPDGGAVAIQVVALRGRKAQQQRVAVANDGIEREGLFLRQRPGLAGIAEQAAERVGAGCARTRCERVEVAAVRDHCRSGTGSGRQLHRQRARLRRIADAGVGAALIFDPQGNSAARADDVRQGGQQFVAIGFSFAEELVLVRFALRQRERAAACVGRDRLHAGAMPVQIVAIGDLPADPHRVRGGGFCAEHIGLIDRQQIGFVDRGGGGQCGEEQQ